MVGTDGIREAKTSVASGALRVAGAEFAIDEGRLGIDMALRFLACQPIPPRVASPDAVVIKANVAIYPGDAIAREDHHGTCRHRRRTGVWRPARDERDLQGPRARQPGAEPLPQLDVAQKVFLGQAPAAGLVPRARHRVATAAILARLAPQIAVDTPVSALGMADRQLVGIARTLARGGRVIAFDEPTSSLTPTGRDGRVVASGAMASRTDAELNSLIPGRGGRHNLAVLRHAVENLAI